MKTIFSVRNLCWFLFLSGMATFSSCKKHSPKPNNNGGDTTSTFSGRLSDEDSLKFYIWYYMESDSANIPIYLWYDQVPSSFNPLSPIFANADSVLYGQQGITSYPMVNGQKVDRYSFLDRTGAEAEATFGGQAGDMGFQISWAADQNGNTSLWVIYSYASSPAGLAGVQRGWQITAVNGNSNISYDGPGYGTGTYTNVERVLNALNSPSASFTFVRPSGSDTTISLAEAVYNLNPVLFDTVYNLNGTNVGYLVFNSFVSVYNFDSLGNITGGTLTKTAIDDAFNKFESAGIKDLIVDERYNLGGAGVTAEYLDDLITPASETGQIMYTTNYNTPIENYFKSQGYDFSVNFQKQGNLALDHVFFIVDGQTASAAELTINNLKPVMDVKLIGSTTYGKPVGEYAQPIYVVNDTTGLEDHMADLYAMFTHVENQAGEGNYYNGMTPDKQVSDYIDLNWGDIGDSSLIEAFNYIQNGNWERSINNYRLVNHNYLFRALPAINKKIINHGRFGGLIYKRLNIREPKMVPFKKN